MTAAGAGTVAGVVAECNVFHRGHGGLFARIRERLGPGVPIVVCMSGNFVQRGDLAVLDKRSRAETVLLGGADLVLELPTPWAAAGAETFALGGVSILAATGVVTHLAFGCESGELAPLLAAREALDDPRCAGRLRALLGEGMTFAAARERAVRTLSVPGAAALRRPNDALGVEYLRALKALGSDMTPLAFPRTGAAHDSEAPGAFPSAAAIRALLLSGGDWEPCVPPGTASVLTREIAAGNAPVRMENCSRAVLARLRAMEEEDFAPYDGGGEGLYRRFFAAVRSSATVDGILAQARTKRYPLARLRRLLLHAYLGVPEAKKGETPPYIRVLGANGCGRALLRRMESAAALPVLTRPSRARRLGGAAAACMERESRCTDLYVLGRPVPGRPGEEYRAGPVIMER